MQNYEEVEVWCIISVPSVSKKKLTLLNSLPNKNCETFSGNFHMYGWLKVSSIIWHQKIWKSVYAWVSTGHFCKGWENWVAQELAVCFGWERSPPPPPPPPSDVKIDDDLVNLWLIMMGMSLCRVWRVPPLAPAPPNHTQPHPITQHVPSPHQ